MKTISTSKILLSCRCLFVVYVTVHYVHSYLYTHILNVFHIPLRQPQRRYNRHNQCTTEKVTHSVGKIPRQPCHNPGNGFLKVQSIHNRLKWRIQCSIQETMSSTYKHIYKGLDLLWHLSWKQHHHCPKYCPDI